MNVPVQLAPSAPLVEPESKLITLSTIRAEEPRWLSPGRIPYGGMTMIAGRPGEGKSQLTLCLAGRVSRGGADVLVIGSEDGLADVVKPRLVAAGADLSRVHAVDTPAGVVLPEEVPVIERYVRETGAALVVVDPVIGHMSPELNMNSDQAQRQALRPLARMAAATGVAVVCVTHLRKSKEGTGLDRIGGGVGFGGIARSAFLLGRYTKDDHFMQEDWRYLVHVKMNAARKAPALSMRLVSEVVDVDDRRIPTSKVVIDEERPEIHEEGIV